MSQIKEYIGCKSVEAVNYDGHGDTLYNIWLTDQEIIRCRDCRRMNEIQPETNQPCSTEPDGFCAWAERREA